MTGSRRAAPTFILLLVTLTILVSWGVRRWVEQHLADGAPLPIVGDVVRLTRGENSGIAFGLLQDVPLVAWASLFALMAIPLVLARALPDGRAADSTLGLVLGGGLANLLDRLGDGRVTDYIDVGLGAWRYPTFNLADSAIVLGLGCALWLLGRPASNVPVHPSAADGGPGTHPEQTCGRGNADGGRAGWSAHGLHRVREGGHDRPR